MGLLCKCKNYTSLNKNLLIIKLDAMGDVLRTTSLLPLINKAWPDMRITWITREESIALLQNNPYITEIIPYGTESIIHLATRSFDRVVNLDTGKLSAGMASLVKSKDKIGFILHQKGYVIGTNRAAEEWLRMGVFDDLKKMNKRSYQQIMCSILGLPENGLRYVLELTENELNDGKRHLKEIGVDLSKKIVGIHTGGGGRWVLKQWSEKKFAELMRELVKKADSGLEIVLFGGPLEREQNKRIMRTMRGYVFDAGCDNDIRHFAAMISHCSVFLSGDSLAMHIAIARGRRTVVLFGPTSSTEIDLFKLGDKIIPNMDCLACYKQKCEYSPNCMDMITVPMVKSAVLQQLKKA